MTTGRTSLSVLAMLFFYCCCCTSPSSVYGWCLRSSSTSTTTTKDYSSVRGRNSLTQLSEHRRRRLTARYLKLDDNEAVCDHADGEDLTQLSTNRIRASSSRRSFLTRSLSLSMVTAGYTLSSSPSSASAAPAASSDGGALFRPNPLTNGLLEQIRIWEQAEADNIKYGGELERGDAGNKGQVSAYPRLLMPILVYATELKAIQQLVRKNSIEAWTDALRILQQPSYDKVTFKKTFNKYGDNIYYSDPDRANLYLGGGATPRTEQSLAYLLRNDVLTNVENLTAELEYLIKNLILDETEDLYQYADIAVGAM
eukprot:CAMPEP_0113504278 /NCGR_PEP_ID=MMETSP0014_2-20120614/34628_1 /TAXON_ID=2857 /ORGANISM="Nitzschia sp." /LENGTH=311 /DNA_ID=CAMNT_0000399373 /DNA_START=126 /DNA_END=1058 /DNA_ORIENTATION=+ /assembly_acc=CAM_ASM_000159